MALLALLASAPALSIRMQAPAAAAAAAAPASAASGKRLLVLGGNGFVGREVCLNAVDAGWTVTSLSRRGESPDAEDPRLSQVAWCAGDATDAETVRSLVDQSDAVIHAIGLLFDVNSGLTALNNVVSGSRSQAGAESTYDNITRKTACHVIDALNARELAAGAPPTPFGFVSCAEAGWPDVRFGDRVEKLAPDWLCRYLAAKRAVEAQLGIKGPAPEKIRPVIVRPSFIWNWKKLDILPLIPVFNTASALGVPFVDKTVRVETLAKALVAGIDDGAVSGVKRYMDMEALAERLP